MWTSSVVQIDTAANAFGGLLGKQNIGRAPLYRLGCDVSTSEWAHLFKSTRPCPQEECGEWPPKALDPAGSESRPEW